MKFVKDENRVFELKKTLDEIVKEAMDGKYNYYDRNLHLKKNRS